MAWEERTQLMKSIKLPKSIVSTNGKVVTNWTREMSGSTRCSAQMLFDFIRCKYIFLMVFLLWDDYITSPCVKRIVLLQAYVFLFTFNGAHKSKWSFSTRKFLIIVWCLCFWRSSSKPIEHFADGLRYRLKSNIKAHKPQIHKKVFSFTITFWINVTGTRLDPSSLSIDMNIPRKSSRDVACNLSFLRYCFWRRIYNPSPVDPHYTTKEYTFDDYKHTRVLCSWYWLALYSPINSSRFILRSVSCGM